MSIVITCDKCYKPLNDCKCLNSQNENVKRKFKSGDEVKNIKTGEIGIFENYYRGSFNEPSDCGVKVGKITYCVDDFEWELSEKIISDSTLKPDSSLDRKNKPVFNGVLQYFPDAIMEISVHSKKGNDKHNPGQELHWDKNKSTDHADCIARHLIDIGPNWDGIDPETGSYHATALAWRSLALLQTLLERNKK